MPTYDHAVGNNGTLRIVDDGSAVHFYVLCSNPATFTGSYQWYGTVNGVGVGGTVSLSAGFGTRHLGSWAVSTTQWVGLGQNDTGTSGLGGASSFNAPINRATVPPAPYMTGFGVNPDQITATSMRVRFNGQGDGGSPITQWNLQRATDAAFTQNVVTITSTGTSIVQGLTPGVTYWWRANGQNAVGTSAWSPDPVSASTVVTGAPGMVVTASLSGESATVVMTPPSGVSSVTSYRVQRRPTVGATVTYNTPTSPLLVSDVDPGSENDYRASAFIGGYQSPWTDWVSVTQPSPNTNPGDYFDGNTAAKADTTYAWDGTANNSISRAIGLSVAGWSPFSQGATVSGGSGVVMRITGGRSQAFAARVSFWTDATAAGYHAGTSYTDGVAFPALAGATYESLIHVRLPVRSQRLAAMLVWLNSGGAEVGRTVGAAQLVNPSSSVWTALSVTSAPPATAVRGSLRVIDVPGTGWALWRSGDEMLLDDAITPFGDYYFDGNTADTSDYVYLWDGAVNASPSTRLTSLVPASSPLLDPDCPPVPPPPRPPLISDSCVEDEISSWRRFWTDIPRQMVPTWVDSVPVLRIDTASQVRLVRVRYYQNPFDRALEEIPVDSYCAEQIISYIPNDTIFTLDGVSQRAWAEVAGSADTLAADHLVSGGSSVPLWPLIGCGSGYYITLDVPTDTPVNALTVSYTLIQRY